jgi:hypothetical protein
MGITRTAMVMIMVTVMIMVMGRTIRLRRPKRSISARALPVSASPG